MELITRYIRQRPRQRSYEVSWIDTELNSTLQTYIGEPINEATIQEIERELMRRFSELEEVEIEDIEIEGDRIVFNYAFTPPRAATEYITVTATLDARPP
jgi:CBS domain containing-hemolysin-like protein